MTPAAAGGADERGLAAAAEAGIHRLSLSTPFQIGRVNCWLIEDAPLTLVDTGPGTASSLAELVTALRRHGHELSDLERIVLTHQHSDHLGLVEILAQRSGAEIAAWHELSTYLADFPAAARADDAHDAALMRRHGVPEDIVCVLQAVAAAFHTFGSSVQLTTPLHDGDVLAFADRRLAVAFRPGHSPSDIVLHDAEREILIAGDHLLANVSSNPIVSRPLRDRPSDPADPDPPARARALQSYIASLQATRELPARFVLGGHGPVICEHAALIERRLRMHERRARKLHAALHDGPLTAHELAAGLWGNIAVTQAFLTLSEVLGHLDLLVADGRVAELADEPVTRFAAR